MKTLLAATLSVTTLLAFILSYFCKLTLDNAEQYLAMVGVIFMDGFFGIIAGTKREGFKTYKALKVLKTFFTWIVILTVVLMVEKGITGTEWLSETTLIPFVVFQLVSVIKNAGDSGFINNDLVKKLLEKIDQHKS